MPKKKRYTTRYILGLATFPFLVIGYFFNKIIWKYLSKRKPFIEWTVLALSITIVVLIISGIIRGDFRASKTVQDSGNSDQQIRKKKH